MQLPIRNIKELLRLTVRVVLQTGCTKDRIRKGDRDRRIVAPQAGSLLITFVFGFEEGIQFPVRITLKKLCPSFQPLGASQSKTFRGDFCDVLKLTDSLEFHDRLHCPWRADLPVSM